MTTTDTDAPKERIARALYENAEYYGPEDAQPAWQSRDNKERGDWREIAAAVLPIVADEVRKAKAEAWDEGAQAQANTYGGQIDTGPNPYRETGDSDDRR